MPMMRRKQDGKRDGEVMQMKATRNEVLSKVTIAVAAVVFALAMSSLAAVESDPLLSALTLCGAVLSGLNGFGRRTARVHVGADPDSRGRRQMIAFPS